MTRRDRAWGGRAWTDPIPTWPRITLDSVRYLPWHRWMLVDIVPISRSGPFAAVGTSKGTFLVRAYREGFAEVRPI